MKYYTNQHIGIKFPLQGLEINKDEEGWLVLTHPSEEAFLSIQFCFQFFASLEEIEEYIQKEIQLVADANNLVQFTKTERKGNDTVTASYFQYIENISHFVFIGVKQLTNNSGYWYMAVTKDEAMSEFCESIFLNTQIIEPSAIGVPDKVTGNKLNNHTLKFLQSYNSNWGSGGGTSTEKDFTLQPDRTFRYNYNSVVSLGSPGGNTSQDNGWGFWEIQKNNEGSFLVLSWHLKGLSVYSIQWDEPGVLFLDGEKYLID